MLLLDRDHSILAFNERVLDWAQRTNVPLLERLRYLSIVSSNLDEFFEVRWPTTLGRADRGAQGAVFAEQFREALRGGAPAGRPAVRALQRGSDAGCSSIRASPSSRTASATPGRRPGSTNTSNARSALLIPVGLDPAHPFPQVASKSLNFIVRLSGKDAFGRDNEIAIVKVPRVLPRLIRMPAKVAGKRKLLGVGCPA